MPETARAPAATGTITSSLFMAGQDAGLSHNMIMQMANIFRRRDRLRAGDPRKGDTMHLHVTRSSTSTGTSTDDGDIVAASLHQPGQELQRRFAIPIDARGEVGYYNEDGVSMRKAFLLAPVDFTRISSNFNLRRLHPIYKTTRPHRGTDYAAPHRHTRCSPRATAGLRPGRLQQVQRQLRVHPAR